MKFFLSSAGESFTSNYAGIITTPGHGGVTMDIRNGVPWAADNQVFTVGFDPDVYFPWLESMKPYRDQCQFVVVPDVVGDAAATLTLFDEWAPRFSGWPLAFVAQDGQEVLEFPGATFGTLFIGGSTAWKESAGAVTCIRRAQNMRLHIHIGRVNWKRRYDMFRVLAGSERFTCDGTRQRYQGVQRTKEAWSGYMNQIPLVTI